MNTTPKSGRITLTLTTRTIKALRLLAILKGETQNTVAEVFLVQGGLHDAVDSEWDGGKPEAASDLSPSTPPFPAAASILPFPSTQPKPEPPPVTMTAGKQKAALPSPPAMAAIPPKIEVTYTALPSDKDLEGEKAPWHDD